jgi:hypothetical protein
MRKSLRSSALIMFESGSVPGAMPPVRPDCCAQFGVLVQAAFCGSLSHGLGFGENRLFLPKRGRADAAARYGIKMQHSHPVVYPGDQADPGKSTLKLSWHAVKTCWLHCRLTWTIGFVSPAVCWP